jgi:subtilisin family serine protease
MDAAEHKADIISMSLGSNVSCELMRDATLYASSLGSILVAAAGNDAEEEWYSGGINYPAAYPWVIAVGAIDSQALIQIGKNLKDNSMEEARSSALLAKTIQFMKR